jgi:hypothetical protein
MRARCELLFMRFILRVYGDSFTTGGDFNQVEL